MLLEKGMGWDGPIDKEERGVPGTGKQAPGIQDSVEMQHSKPLYEVVADHIETWKQIGAPQVVLDWITDGVYFPLDSTPPNFFHK